MINPMYTDLIIKSDKEEFDEAKFKEISRLFIEDGWSYCSQDFSDCNVLVLTDSGLQDVKLRYLEWTSDYSDWHWKTFYYPTFFTSEEAKDEDLDDAIDNTHVLLVATQLPRMTENSKKAEELLNEYWDSIT